MTWSSLLSLAANLAAARQPAQAAAVPLHYPLPPLPRVAVFDLHVDESRLVRQFPAGAWSSLNRFRPASIAAGFHTLALIAHHLRRGTLTFELSSPLLVFSSPEKGPLTAFQHDQLWAWFGLPIYEQIRDARGELLAETCDAHGDFHLRTHNPSQLSLEPAGHSCLCGRTDPIFRIHPTRCYAGKS